MSYNLIRKEGSKTDIERKARAKGTLFDVYQGCPHYPRQGTPPNMKTIRRLSFQRQLGMTDMFKRTYTKEGKLVHPTKGFRKW